MPEPRLLVVALPDTGSVSILSAFSGEPEASIPSVEPERALAMLPHYDVALLVHHPEEDWIPAFVERCFADDPAITLVVINVPHRRRTVLNYLLANVHGYTFVDDAPERLIEIIAAARRGDLIVDPRTAALIVDEVNELRSQLNRAGLFSFHGEAQDVLSPREQEILELIALEDLSNREIADRLFIEVGTVKNHVHSILHKLGVHNREQAAHLLRAPIEESGP
jgi:DNA-binding NarL/FixJ family response regulator